MDIPSSEGGTPLLQGESGQQVQADLVFAGDASAGADEPLEASKRTSRAPSGAASGPLDGHVLDVVTSGESTILGVSLNMVNVIIGAGIVGLPYAFLEAGFFAGIGAMLFTAVLTDYSVRLLVATGVAHGEATYEGLARRAFGVTGYRTVCCLLLTFDYGAMLSYLVILGDTSRLCVCECGVVQRGAVWCSAVRCGAVRCGAA